MYGEFVFLWAHVKGDLKMENRFLLIWSLEMGPRSILKKMLQVI